MQKSYLRSPTVGREFVSAAAGNLATPKGTQPNEENEASC
jgi:hypothetical protein